MAKYQVFLVTTAEAAIDVDTDDLDLPPDATEEEIRDAVIDAAYDESPDICAHCSGMGMGSKYSMGLGDWEVADDEDAVREVIDDE